MWWRLFGLICCVCIFNCLGKETIANGNNTHCPKQERMMSPCKEECDVDKNCTDSQICCFGSCQKNPGATKPEFYKTCTDPDPCSMGVCKNNATCKLIGKLFKCFCAAGYFGLTCEYEINDCDPNPCLNNGTCIDLVNDYACCCPEGYTGENCEKENLCSPCKLKLMECPRYKDAECVLMPRFVIKINNKTEDVTDSCNNQSP